jgi:hypothetical protein
VSGPIEQNQAGSVAKLRKARGIGFDDVVFHIERGDLPALKVAASVSELQFP